MLYRPAGRAVNFSVIKGRCFDAAKRPRPRRSKCRDDGSARPIWATSRRNGRRWPRGCAMPLIAVIDDRLTNRSILAKLATSLGEDMTVRAFGDPKTALEWAADHSPDLVITDYKMPKLDGAEF